MRHNIVGSESLGRRTFAPGYGAMVVTRRARRLRVSRVGVLAFALLVLAALVVIGARIA